MKDGARGGREGRGTESERKGVGRTVQREEMRVNRWRLW